MKILALGFRFLSRMEKVSIIFAALIAIGLAYVSIPDHGVLSNEVIGPVVLMFLAWRSMLMLGIMRLRASSMNMLYVTTLKALKDARELLGEEIPIEVTDMIAKYVGDKE